jgi:hypothetical protein
MTRQIRSGNSYTSAGIYREREDEEDEDKEEAIA